MSDIEVVVIDDHPAILAGVTAWYAAADPPIRVVAAAGDPEIAWTSPGDSAPIVVLDLQLRPDAEPAFAEIRRLADAGRHVIVYSMRADNEAALTAIDLGAHSYLTKAEGDRHLIAATQAAAAQKPYVPPVLAGAISADRRPESPQLAPRETQVLLEWFRCQSKDMVAQKLGLSASTIASYIDRVRIKYANAGRPADTKAALVARAIQDGLIGPDDL